VEKEQNATFSLQTLQYLLVEAQNISLPPGARYSSYATDHKCRSVDPWGGRGSSPSQ